MFSHIVAEPFGRAPPTSRAVPDGSSTEATKAVSHPTVGYGGCVQDGSKCTNLCGVPSVVHEVFWIWEGAIPRGVEGGPVSYALRAQERLIPFGEPLHHEGNDRQSNRPARKATQTRTRTRASVFSGCADVLVVTRTGCCFPQEASGHAATAAYLSRTPTMADAYGASGTDGQGDPTGRNSGLNGPPGFSGPPGLSGLFVLWHLKA